MFDQLVSSVQKIIVLSDEELGSISRFFVPKKIRKRQYMLNAGDVCRHVVFVKKGFLRSYSIDDNAQEHVMQFATEGWWISDMGSFLSGDEAIYNIQAIEDSELLLLSKEGMDEIMNQIPKMERYFRLLMQSNIVALQRRLRVVQTHSAEEVYLKLMEVRPEIISRAPQQYVASYLGITPETLSRIRKQVSGKK